MNSEHAIRDRKGVVLSEAIPQIILIVGPNGAGKSTLAPLLLRDKLKLNEYVNADTIALGLSAFAPESAAIEAGRVMLKRLRDLAAQQKVLRLRLRWRRGRMQNG